MSESGCVRVISMDFSMRYPRTYRYVYAYKTKLATLDKGKHDKQQKNGLSTLPKTPPGCKKGGVFA